MAFRPGSHINLMGNINHQIPPNPINMRPQGMMPGFANQQQGFNPMMINNSMPRQEVAPRTGPMPPMSQGMNPSEIPLPGPGPGGPGHPGGGPMMRGPMPNAPPPMPDNANPMMNMMDPNMMMMMPQMMAMAQMAMSQNSAASTKKKKKASLWTEHTSPDGRTYYYHSETKQSSWSKPDELKTPSERLLSKCPWKEHKHAETGTVIFHSILFISFILVHLTFLFQSIV